MAFEALANLVRSFPVTRRSAGINPPIPSRRLVSATLANRCSGRTSEPQSVVLEDENSYLPARGDNVSAHTDSPSRDVYLASRCLSLNAWRDSAHSCQETHAETLTLAAREAQEQQVVENNKANRDLQISLHEIQATDASEIREGQQPSGRLYPDLDADDEYVHFEMSPMRGDSLLWLTLRRGITPERASLSLRKIADLIDRNGLGLVKAIEGRNEPLRLGYNEDGDIIVQG